MPLTATTVKQAKPKDKPYKLSDGGGLHLLVNPAGAKYWRYKYRYAGKEKNLALGVYPEVSLKSARQKHQAARDQLAKGIDPGEARKVEKLTRHIANAESFEAIAMEWYATKMCDKSESHRKRTLRSMEKDLFPKLGRRPVSEINAPELLATLRHIEARGALETAHRAKQTAGQIFRYAIVTGRAGRDPSGDLKGALSNPKKKHLAAITEPTEVGQLLVAMDGFQGTPVVKAALLLSPLLFQRPGEIRAMEWNEINWEEKHWKINAEKTKMRRAHIVPLCTQALALIRELEPLTGRGQYVFPSARGASRCLSENGVRTALRTLGYDNETMTPHGFRAMARTILDEVLNFRVDLIEHQLAHAVRDPTGRAYNRTSFIEERHKMMQIWADYLDSLRDNARSGDVIASAEAFRQGRH
jgi:integrase